MGELRGAYEVEETKGERLNRETRGDNYGKWEENMNVFSGYVRTKMYGLQIANDAFSNILLLHLLTLETLKTDSTQINPSHDLKRVEQLSLEPKNRTSKEKTEAHRMVLYSPYIYMITYTGSWVMYIWTWNRNMLEKECNSFSTRKAFLVPRIVSIRPRIFQMEQHEDDGYDYGRGTNDEICDAEKIVSSS